MNVLDTGHGELIQPPDMDAFREWNRTHKSRKLEDKLMDEHEAIARFVTDGSYIGTELYGTVRAPMSLVREVVRQKPKNLRLAAQGALDLDLLLAGGQIDAIEIVYYGLEVYGVSHIFRRAVESGQVKRCVEWSNASFTWRLKAAAMGVPFLPVRSLLGTDTFKYSAAKVVEDPFTGSKVCLVPALVLDVSLIHVHRADRYGNAQIEGINGLAYDYARASKRVILSAEEIIDTDEIRRHPDRTVIPYYLVDAVVHAPYGSHPGETVYSYARDEEAIREWVNAAQTPESTAAYLDSYVYGVPDHAAYLERIGSARLDDLRRKAEAHR
ncbi:MAG: CoA transferase subunit A [Chloroflexi bacterium]|nr:CoA transferase subunit A [Chloroflexota bacterium]